MPAHNTQKTTLRQTLLKEREALLPAQVKDMSSQIHNHLRTTAIWQQAQEVLLYIPVRNEVDTLPLVEELLMRKARVLLPRCCKNQPGRMDVACIEHTGQLTQGAFGILEPEPAHCPALEEVQPDCILVPGAAFDNKGQRLGYGGGFYDRFLERMEKKPPLVALAYSVQLVSQVPADPWDIPMHVIITEKGIHWI